MYNYQLIGRICKSQYLRSSSSPIRKFNMLSWVNHQLRPWLFMNRPKASPNYAKYQSSPWILQTSINLVPPSDLSVSGDEVSFCMLWCVVHVSSSQPRVQGPFWLKNNKFHFNFSLSFFLLFFQFYPSLIIHLHPYISFRHIKQVLDSPLSY